MFGANGMYMQGFRVGIGGLLLMVMVGCSASDSRLATNPATGKVMFKKNTPAVDALVVFHPSSPGFEKEIDSKKPFARVKEDGTFTLTTYEDGDGAPTGEYGVTIDWRVKGKESKFAMNTEGGNGTKSMLSSKYGNPQQPFIKVTVKKGEPNQFTFDVD